MNLSDFSMKLKDLCNRKDVTIKGLADDCNIDRTFLHKIIKGERKPPNVEFVHEISKQLRLTEEEKEELLMQYRIIEMGEKVYLRRQKVAGIIHDIANKKFESEKSIDFRTEIDVNKIPEVTTFYEQKEFIKNIQIIVSYDIQHGSDLKIIAQPSENLNNILRYCVGSNEKCQVRHVFCLDNANNEQNDVNYNLEVFPLICDFAVENFGYKPFYYYDNAALHINSSAVLPYAIITDNFVVCFDRNFSEGIVYKSQSLVKFYNNIYSKFETQSMALTEVTNDVIDMVNCFYDYKNYTINFDYQPCTVCAVDEKMYNKHVVVGDDLKKWLGEVVINQQKYFLNSTTVNLFCEEGLEMFMNEGTIVEIPNGMYTPPDIEERQFILKKIIEFTEKDECKFRIIKNNLLKSSPNLCVNIINNKMLKIITRKNESMNFSYININEMSLVEAFTDYFVYLCESDDICTKEETISIMKKYIH